MQKNRSQSRLAAESEFFPRLGIRAEGFATLFTHLRERAIRHAPLVLVETGCVRYRDLNWIGDGCSSILFHAFSVSTKSQFISIDIERSHCEIARQYCPGATFICDDSVQALHHLRATVPRIDLLYLDSYDVDWGNPHPSALHHLNELCAASPMLPTGSLVFVDDNKGGIGKGMYVRQYMKRIGATQISDDYLIGFVLP
jgi:hypothetical protein